MTKITKKEMFALIKEAIVTGIMPAAIDEDAIVEFCDKEIAALDRKAGKAKETAARKRAEGDELTERVAEVLSEDLTTIADITELIGDEAVSKAKVQYRLNQLVKAGRAVKEEMTVETDGKKRKVMGFALATDAE
ncbi:MAG: hypothetical protein IKB70_08065 [Bacilli bacterium]|nr:hypothetical protein [Bacilli bacterium]